jgi:hypothetical protein
LLIERYKYFSKFPSRHKQAWYVYPSHELQPGKHLLFENIGIVPVRVNDYSDIYLLPWENS